MGGDWYDVFTLPSGVLGIVVGDVSGHGLAAAVVMGRLRSALRAYALALAGHLPPIVATPGEPARAGGARLPDRLGGGCG